jgi:hypothetical protein
MAASKLGLPIGPRRVLAHPLLAGLLLSLLAAHAQAGDVSFALEPGRLPGTEVVWDETEILLNRIYGPQHYGATGVLPASADVPLEQLAAGPDYYEVAQEDERRDENAPPAGAASTQPPTQPLGQAPPDNSLEFLRTVTVLLQPGQMQIDYGGRYTWRDDTILPGLLPSRNRQIYSPFAIRYGYTERMQLFANVPVGLAIGEDDEDLLFAGPDRFSCIFGVGDSTFGTQYLLRDGYCDQCDVVGTLSFTAPLGHHPFEKITNPGAFLVFPTGFSGAGFWGVNTNLTFIKTYDPCVVFGSVGYSHLFARTFGEGPVNFVSITPGEQFNYSLGMGFAINDRLTLSTAFFGAFQTTTIVDAPAGSPLFVDSAFNLEPFQVRLALTAITSPVHIVEPFVAFGLNEDAPEADFGITWTRTF